MFAHACVWYGEVAGVVVDKHVGRWQAVREEERVQEKMDLRERLGAVDLARREDQPARRHERQHARRLRLGRDVLVLEVVAHGVDDLLPNQSHTRCARFGVPTGKTAIASMTLANSSNEQNGCSA